MKIINLKNENPFVDFVELYDKNDGIKIYGKFFPKSSGSKVVDYIQLKLYFEAGLEEQYNSANLCCTCKDCYVTDEVFFIEVHFIKKDAPSQNGMIEIPDQCLLEIKSNTIIHVNKFIYENENEIKPCKYDYGLGDQPERKKGNILVGG